MNFGHDQDPATDFCMEVQAIEDELAGQRAGMPARFDLGPRIERAMQFTVGGNARAVVAKSALRTIEIAYSVGRQARSLPAVTTGHDLPTYSAPSATGTAAQANTSGSASAPGMDPCTRAAYDHAARLVAQADVVNFGAPLWYSWALRHSFMAGAQWQAGQPIAPTTWRAMVYAPLDGTEVELLLYHPDRAYATGDDKKNWEQVVRAKWIDFNGGGWTWHGMNGTPQGWRPAPDREAPAPDSAGAAITPPTEKAP